MSVDDAARVATADNRCRVLTASVELAARVATAARLNSVDAASVLDAASVAFKEFGAPAVANAESVELAARVAGLVTNFWLAVAASVLDALSVAKAASRCRVLARRVLVAASVAFSARGAMVASPARVLDAASVAAA